MEDKQAVRYFIIHIEDNSKEEVSPEIFWRTFKNLQINEIVTTIEYGQDLTMRFDPFVVFKKAVTNKE